MNKRQRKKNAKKTPLQRLLKRQPGKLLMENSAGAFEIVAEVRSVSGPDEYGASASSYPGLRRSVPACLTKLTVIDVTSSNPDWKSVAAKNRESMRECRCANTQVIQTAEAWAEEGQRKYGAGAIAWLQRWKVNCQHSPENLKELDEAIAILSKTRARSTIG